MCLELRNIEKAFGDQIVFKSLSLDLSYCGFYLITGKSGSGKSTLLNILAGYESINKGERYLSKQTSIACIFQSYELIEELTVEENILMIHEHCDEEIFDQLDIQHLLKRYPDELSQGQKQRVGIARALCCHPQIIICDEPTESLDNENKERVLKLLKTLSYDHVVVVVSHDVTLLQTYFDYHYEIKDCQLIEVSHERRHQKLEGKDSDIHIENNKVKQIIHKVTYKRTFFQTLFMSIFIFMQLILFFMGASLFTDQDDYSAVNKESLYVKTYHHSSDLLDQYCSNKRPIIEFGAVAVKNKLIKMDIYPQSQEDHLSMTVLKDNEILINQNVAQILKEELHITDQDVINYVMTFHYQLGQSQYTLSCKVKEIVQEDVGDLKQVYYSYEGINALLQQRKFSNEFPTQYDYFIHNSDFFELQCGDHIKDSFQQLLENNDYSIYHSLYSQQQDQLGQKQLYQYLFTAVQTILAVVTIIYVVYIPIKESKRSLTSLSLIHATGVPILKVKKLYLQEKIKPFVTMVLLVFLGMIVMKFLWQQPFSIMMCGYVVICYTLYMLVFVLKMKNLQQKDISIILKEGKDI